MTFYDQMVKDLFKTAPDETGMARMRDYYDLLHGASGLVQEAVEVLEIIHKHVFFGKEIDFDHLKSEIGDCEFYLTALHQRMYLTREQTREDNWNKLMSRHKSGRVEDYYE